MSVQARIKGLRWVVAGTLLSLAVPCQAQSVDDVFPMEPEDRATVGKRPRFRVGVEGRDLVKMRFKIVLSDDDFETEAYVFDQLERRSGWAIYNPQDEQQGAYYLAREPLDDGEYEWKVFAWDGLEWVEGDTVFRVRVDSVVPAPVENVRLSRVGPSAIQLEWDPVVLDARGRPESVARYHVYRFFRKRPFYIRGYEIGVTDDTRFLDDRDEVGLVSTLFYKVTAEDTAGNHPIHMPKWEHEIAQEEEADR